MWYLSAAAEIRHIKQSTFRQQGFDLNINENKK